MAALIAQEHFKIKRVVARIYDPERSHMYRDFGVATICPTTVGARLMANALIDDAYRRLPFERPDVEVLEVRVGDRSAGKTVADLTVAGKTQVCVVIRREESLIPTPDLTLQRDDRIVVVVQPDYLEQFRKSVETELARTA
jgi:trk system potassium uptake protein TrkA